jgi:hypothetical protein
MLASMAISLAAVAVCALCSTRRPGGNPTAKRRAAQRRPSPGAVCSSSAECAFLPNNLNSTRCWQGEVCHPVHQFFETSWPRQLLPHQPSESRRGPVTRGPGCHFDPDPFLVRGVPEQEKTTAGAE